jgi:hypothetical protein
MAKDFVEQVGAVKYRHDGEITNTPGNFLVQGSHDCVIVNGEKVSSRKGYSLVGATKTKNKGIKSGYDWNTNRGATRSVRVNDDGEVDVYFNGSWIFFKQLAKNARCNFKEWWDNTEKIDELLFVDQTDGVHMWSGGVVEIASSTAITLTMKGYLAGTTIAFVEGGASNDTITDSGNGFVTAGFTAGDEIIITGSASNNGTYTILTVTAGTITLSSDDDLVDEVAGASVVIKKPNATWGEQGFLTAGTRKVVVDGVEYAYTGGEGTGTLTGLSGVPGTVTDGDIAIQAVITTTPATLDNLTLDLIGVFNNYVLYGDMTHRVVYMSKSSDYDDFGYTSPIRKPAEGMLIQLDSTPTAFIVEGGGSDDFYISGGKNDWFKVTLKPSADLASESVTVTKLPTATGQAARSQGAVVNIKNGVAFLNFEPTIDTLSRILAINTPTSRPISDDISDDILSYNLTDANGVFYQNQIFFAFPAEGIVQIYDTEQQIWQPPHRLPVGKLALIDVDGDGTQVLCGHSYTSNETYKLYDGYNDNGADLDIAMVFGYENFGTRFSEKTDDEYATELYMSENTVVTEIQSFDFNGGTAQKQFEIRGDDTTIQVGALGAGGIGFAPLGSNPIGSLATPVDDLSKYRVANVSAVQGYFEKQRAYMAQGEDIRFSIIATGSNTKISNNIPQHIKR